MKSRKIINSSQILTARCNSNSRSASQNVCNYLVSGEIALGHA